MQVYLHLCKISYLAGMANILMTTTNVVEGYRIRQYLGILTGEVIIGTNVIRDFFGGVLVPMRRFCERLAGRLCERWLRRRCASALTP